MAQYSQLFEKRVANDEFEHKTTQDKTSGNKFPAVSFVLLKQIQSNQQIERELTRFF